MQEISLCSILLLLGGLDGLVLVLLQAAWPFILRDRFLLLKGSFVPSMAGINLPLGVSTLRSGVHKRVQRPKPNTGMAARWSAAARFRCRTAYPDRRSHSTGTTGKRPGS